MKAKIDKLAKKLADAGPAADEIAARLVAAGLDNPAKIRKASDQELEAIEGVGPVTRQAIRRKFKKAK